MSNNFLPGDKIRIKKEYRNQPYPWIRDWQDTVMTVKEVFLSNTISVEENPFFYAFSGIEKITYLFNEKDFEI